MPANAANPYSECGLGAAIFPTNGVAAAISNVIWDVGSTAITSVTMSPETCNEGAIDTAKFILETIDNLESDVALGEGEHLLALATLMQCDASTNMATMTSASYGAYVSSAAYSSAGKTDKASTFYDIVKASDTQTCETRL